MLPPTIVHNLDRGRVRFADRPLLLDGARTVGYHGFAELVEGAAAALARAGAVPGDRVAVAARNGVEVAVAIWACARGGFVFVGLPTTLRAEQWTYLLAHSRARLALGQAELLDGLEAAAAEAGLPPGSVRPVEELTAEPTAWRPQAPLPGPDGVYAVIFTSGTTGRPKAAMLTHRMSMTVAGFYTGLLGLTPDDRTAIHLPFYYVSGHVSQLNPFLLAGGSAVTMARFTPGGLVAVLRERRVSVIDVVPSIAELLLGEPSFDGAALPHLRAAYYGGAPMPPSTVDGLRERVPRLRLYEVYGMSETGGTITALSDVDVGRRPGTVGRPVPGAEVRLVDDDGADAPPGEAGELLVRGPMVFPGYLDDPAATGQALREGWLHTGDLARVDGEGYVSIVGRKKEMIIRGGVKVYPAELEALLERHPAVERAAVFGLPDPLATELVAAAVVAAPGAEVDVTALRSFVREHLAAHAVPRHVRVVESLPHNPTGKVDKALLRERLLTELRG